MRLHLFPILLFATISALLGGCSAQSRKEKHLKNADGYYASGDFDKAEIEYLNVLKIENLNPQAVSRLAIIYFEQGRLGRVMPFLAKGQELQPDNLDLKLKAGMVALASGDPAAARGAAVAVLDQRPEDPEAPILLVEASQKPEDAAQARAKLQGLPSSLRESPAVLVALGMLDIRQGKTQEGVALLERALAKDPKFGAAHAALGPWVHSQGDTAKAMEHIRLAAENSPLRSPRRLLYARMKGSTGDMEGARKELEKITADAPDYLPAWILLADLAASEKKFDEAHTSVGKVLARDSLHPEAMLLSARIHLATGDKAKALAEMERMLRTYPRSPQALFHMGVVQIANGETAKAIASLSQASTLAPTFPDPVIMLAELNLRRGEARLATDALAPLVKARPELTHARVLLANAYQTQGRHNEALAIYDDLAKSPDRAVQASFMRATIFEQQNKFPEARAALAEVFAADPNFMPAHRRMVDLDIKEKKFDAALARTNELIARNPKLADAYLLQASVHLAQKQLDRAEAAMRKAIEVDPESQTAYFSLARFYIVTNQMEKALANFEAVVAKEPNNAEIWMIIGTIYDQQKNFEKARAAYEKLVAASPRFSPGLNNLAYLYSEHFNQLEKAREMAERARELLPYDPHVADTLGWIVFKQGDYVRASALLTESAAKLPQSPEVQYHLGAAQYMLGLGDAARQTLQRAVDTNVDFHGKPDALSRLAVLAIDPATAPASARAELEKRIAADANDVGALARLAQMHVRSGDTAKANELLQRVIRISPSHVRASLALVQLHLQRGDGAAALELARSVRKTAPDDPDVTRTLGLVAYQTGDHSWAYSLLQEAARRKSDDTALQFDLARAAYSVGRVDEAQNVLRGLNRGGAMNLSANDARDFAELISLAEDPALAAKSSARVQAALAADAKSLPALLARARAADHNGDVAAAVTGYEQLLTSYPEFAPARRRLAVLIAQDGDVQKAYQTAMKARESFRNDPELERAFGIILYRQKEYARAVSALSALAANRPNDGELHYFLGMAQARLDRAAESKRSLTHALEQNLKAEHAAAARETLASLKD